MSAPDGAQRASGFGDMRPSAGTGAAATGGVGGMADANVLIPDTVTSVEASESCTILDPVGSTSGMNAVQFHQFLWYSTVRSYNYRTVIGTYCVPYRKVQVPGKDKRETIKHSDQTNAGKVREHVSHALLPNDSRA